jgi:NADH-quinone oxidoreductase subunit F
MYHILDRIKSGEAEAEDIDLLNDVAGGMAGKCLCALGEFAIMPVLASIEHFRSDFEAHIRDER